jgi:hypothetical protein
MFKGCECEGFAMNTQAQINGGKIGAAITNYKRREKVKQAERRTSLAPVATACKCPACWTIHMVMLAPAEVGKFMPRLFCPQHEKRRNLSEAYVYGRVC